MPDWDSPQEEAINRRKYLSDGLYCPSSYRKTIVSFVKLIHAMAGVYLWEFVTSLHFEWSFISGKKKFTWPMIFYFSGRYCALCSVVTVLVALDSVSEVNCQALYTAIAVFTQLTIGFASINLALRAMVICSMSWFCIVPLSLAIAGHWAILLQSVRLTATRIPGTGCLPSQLPTTNLAISFGYSVVLDFAIVLLCASQILRVNTSRSQLLSLMYRDGLTCFIVATLVNLPAAVLAALRFNTIMETMFTIPAAVLSTIVVCRAVRRLSNFSRNVPAVYMTSPDVEQAYPRSKSCDMTHLHGASILSNGTTPSSLCMPPDIFVVSDLISDDVRSMDGSSTRPSVQITVESEDVDIEKACGDHVHTT